MELKIESVDLQSSAAAPIVEMIAESVEKAFQLNQKRKELPRYLKKREAVLYMNCSYNTLSKFIDSGLKVVIIDGVQRIDQRDCDEFMANHKI